MQVDVPVPDLSNLPLWSYVAAWYAAATAYMRLSGYGRWLVELGRRPDQAPALLSIPFWLLASPAVAAFCVVKWLVAGRAPKPGVVDRGSATHTGGLLTLSTTTDDKFDAVEQKLAALNQELLKQKQQAQELAERVELAVRNGSERRDELRTELSNSIQRETDQRIEALRKMEAQVRAEPEEREMLRKMAVRNFERLGNDLSALSAQVNTLSGVMSGQAERLAKVEAKPTPDSAQGKAYWVGEGEQLKEQAAGPVTVDGRVWHRWWFKQPEVGEEFHFGGYNEAPIPTDGYIWPHTRISATHYQLNGSDPGPIKFLDNYWWTSLKAPPKPAETKPDNGWIQYKDKQPEPGSEIEWYNGQAPDENTKGGLHYLVTTDGKLRYVNERTDDDYSYKPNWDTCWWRTVQTADKAEPEVGVWVRKADKLPAVGRHVQIWNGSEHPPITRTLTDCVYRVATDSDGCDRINFTNTSAVWWRYVPESSA